MKKYLPGFIIGVLLIAAIFWGFKNFYLDHASKDDPINSASTHEAPTGVLEPPSEPGPAEMDEATTGRSSAKRIVRVPDKSYEETQPERDPDIKLQESTKRMLESALNGEAEKAINISRLARQCNQQMTEEWVRIRLEKMSKADFNTHTTHSFGNGETRSFNSFQEYESTLWAEFDQCRSIQSLFNDDLRERLQYLAENGNVVARYLYAMWPPKQGGLGSEETLQVLEYQNRALEYTWLNIDEDEPLGVLAFGQSFDAGAPGLFTPRNFVQNEIFLLAAKKCGLGGPWLESKVAEIRQTWIGRVGDVPFEESADDIKELFCD